MYLNKFSTEFYCGPSDGQPLRLLTYQGELVVDTGRRKVCLSVKGWGRRLVRALGTALGARPADDRRRTDAADRVDG